VTYGIETKAGMLPYAFGSIAEAKEYAIGILSWSGTPYRIIEQKEEA
jgi:hypothetical protein